MSEKSFIADIAPHAQKIQSNYNILASLIIAQACHESNFGKSGLATNGKNLFGVKGTYKGNSVNMRTWEEVDGKKVYIDANFRKYPSWYESFQDLANLYINGVSWDKDKYKAVIGETDYKKACKAVQAAGYATDSNYSNALIKMIEMYNLTQYDKGGSKVTAPAKETSKKETSSSGSTYKVKKGDSLSKIAAEKKTTVKALQDLNNISDPDHIEAGQTLKIPAATTTSKKTSSSGSTYKVKKGDTLTKIAKAKGTTVKAIQELNKISNPDHIEVGQTLKIPDSNEEPKYHVVKKGDTVSGLAKKYGSTQAQIKSWNKLADVNLIKLGQTLRVK